MEATLHKNEFMPNIQRAQNVVQKKTAMPILGNVLLEALGDRIKMYATDLEVGIVEECPAKVEKQGTCSVGARKLFEIVKELPDKDIRLVKKENVLEILCHSSTFRLRVLPAEDFPRLPKFESSRFLTVPSAVFKDLIRNTIFSVSTDEMRYHLNGFLTEMETRDGKALMRMVSTDAHRLSMCERELPEGTQCLEELVRTEKKGSARNDVILPRKGVLEIGRMVEDGKGELLFGIDRTNAMVKKDGTTLVMRLIEGKFPDYRSVIPTQCGSSLAIEGSKLAESLRRMLTLSSEKSWGVHFHLKEGELTLSSSNPEFGEAEETLEVVYQGEPTRIGFNARYLLDVLQVSEGEVTIEFSGEVQPCVIRSTADQSSLFIVMPMRL